MSFVFEPAVQVAVPVRSSGLELPVRRIYCVGRNYADHVREMGGDPNASPPFFFAKPADALVETGTTLPYPSATEDLHHEVELVVALAEGGQDIPAEAAEAKVFGYAVGIDLTRRDLQAMAKKAGQPWEAGKALDQGAPCSTLVPASEVGHLNTGRISLAVNGETRQDGDLAQMIWPVPHIIAKLSALFTLAPGDLIFTGTPAGVGAIGPGDQVSAAIEGIGDLEIAIGPRDTA
jgi:fumarylpyruvate hydrolase